MGTKLERTANLLASFRGKPDEASRLSGILQMTEALDADFAVVAGLMFDRRTIERRVSALRTDALMCDRRTTETCRT